MMTRKKDRQKGAKRNLIVTIMVKGEEAQVEEEKLPAVVAEAEILAAEHIEMEEAEATGTIISTRHTNRLILIPSSNTTIHTHILLTKCIKLNLKTKCSIKDNLNTK